MGLRLRKLKQQLKEAQESNDDKAVYALQKEIDREEEIKALRREQNRNSRGKW
jgi:hypothetical protein